MDLGPVHDPIAHMSHHASATIWFGPASSATKVPQGTWRQICLELPDGAFAETVKSKLESRQPGSQIETRLYGHSEGEN